MLFHSFQLKKMTLANRIVMAPMCQYSALADGKATDWHFVHYTSRAVGGAGLIIIEATGVEPGGRISSQDLGLWDDEQVTNLRRIVTEVHKYNSKIAIQLNHAGRKSQVESLLPVAPSAVPFGPEDRMPQALSKMEIQVITMNFAQAARRAVAAGFDAIEIHGAHGYLLNQFLSPLANQRNDEYGGSPENRARFLGEVIEAVRRVIPAEMPLIVRVSAHDYDTAGNTPEDIAVMLNLVKEKGIDLIDVSSGAVTPLAPKAYPGYQIGFAMTIKELTGLPVIGGGLITEAVQAEQIIKGGIDLLFLGRELLRNPYWPLATAHELREDIIWPKPYERSRYR
ncbi:MAG: NADPH dehydrogenase NamA [Sporomusaceae bacterium]|nr:NADPH dehydrogenase NamA [Sporomusaceae bacterium]